MQLPRPEQDELRQISDLFRHIGSDNALTQYIKRAITDLGKDLDLAEGERTHKLQGARLALRDLVSTIDAATKRT